ncbi:MAG: hypothetical protein WC048_03760 [Rhizobium sp.]
MPKLSVCIPVEPEQRAPTYLAGRLLENPESSIEIVVAPSDAACEGLGNLRERAAKDGRLKILPSASDETSVSDFWIATIAEATGDWITLVSPEDMIEPDLPALLSHIEKEHTGVDALGWNAFQIAPNAPRDTKAAVAIPIVHDISELEKTKMLEAFFQWSGSQQVPRMPFGLYHGAIKRELAQTILSASSPLSWLTPLPRWEWAARVLIFANGLGLSNRPLSAVSTAPFRAVDVPSALRGFPFDARIGVTATIAEVQARVLHELGAAWSGFNENFVKACMFDCMHEHEEEAFERKCQSYFSALHRMPGGPALAETFRPQFFSRPPEDARRGLHGRTLLVDRFIGNARTAQEFYEVVRSMIAPIAVITGHLELLSDKTSNGLVSAA